MKYQEFKRVLESNKYDDIEAYDEQKNDQKFTFRNYHPKIKSDKFIFEPTTHLRIITSVVNEFKSEIDECINNFLNEEKQQLNIIPKKSNVDLKKQIAKQQNILNQRVDLAIISLLKEKCQVKETKEQDKIEEEQIPVKKDIFQHDIVYDKNIETLEENEYEFSGNNMVENLNLQASLFEKLGQDSDSSQNDD